MIFEIKYILCLTLLFLASYQDIKTREISIIYPITLSIIGTVFTLYELFVKKTLTMQEILISIISGIIILLIIYITGLMGYGDALIFFSLSLTFPHVKLLPEIFHIFVNSILSASFIPIILFIYNIKNIKYVKSIKDFLLLFVSYPKKKSEIGKFEIIVKEGERMNIIFNVEKTEFSKPENSDEIVWVTYGLPFVVFITIGTIMYIFFGNPLLNILFKNHF